MEPLLRRLERLESPFSLALAVDAAILSISPPVTSQAQLIALVGTALFAAAWIVIQWLKQDVAAAVARDQRDWLERQFASLRRAQAAPARQALPRIRLDFSWQEGEPKDKPIVVRNSGGGEALRVQVRAIEYGQCVASFGQAPPLAPAGTHNLTIDIDCHDIGPLLLAENLIDFLEKGLRQEQRRLREEGQAARRPAEDWTEDLDFFVRMALKARVDSRCEVVVTYEDERAKRFATVYQLEFTMWGRVTRVALNWVEDR